MSAFFANPEAMILLAGLLLSIAAALPGSFLVLRGSALLTDAISHAVVFGIAVTWLVTGLVSGPIQVIGAALAGLTTVLLIEALTRSGRIKADAAMGLVFPTLFAGGVLIINLYARQIHLDIDTVLLGEIAYVWLDTQTIAGVEIPNAVLTLGFCALLNAAYVTAFWKELKVACFDPDYAALQGLRPSAIFAGLLALTSATAVAALDAVGAILFVAFVIVPATTAYLWTNRLSVMVPLATLLGCLATLIGDRFAFALDVSIGGSMAMMTGVLFILSLFVAPGHGIFAALVKRREARAGFALRTLLSHLYTHQDEAHRLEEMTVHALEDHLHWSRAEAEKIILRGMDQGLILRQSGLLRLTEMGEAAARQTLENVAPASLRPSAKAHSPH